MLLSKITRTVTDHQPLSLSSAGEGLATCQSQQSGFIPSVGVQEDPLCVQLLGIALLLGQEEPGCFSPFQVVVVGLGWGWGMGEGRRGSALNFTQSAAEPH